MADWRAHIIDDPPGLRALIQRVRRIAVLGIKTIDEDWQPAYYVPKYVQDAGFQVVPVPIYFPEATEILGQRVYRRLLDVPAPLDLVNVFRRPRHLAAHLDDILAARPGAVWLQSGISDDAFARQLAESGIDVVQDRCLMVELQRIGR